LIYPPLLITHYWALANVAQGFLQGFITALREWSAMTKINRFYIFLADVFQGLYKTWLIATPWRTNN
jgi:hypothetical protein